VSAERQKVPAVLLLALCAGYVALSLAVHFQAGWLSRMGIGVFFLGPTVLLSAPGADMKAYLVYTGLLAALLVLAAIFPRLKALAGVLFIALWMGVGFLAELMSV